MSIDYRTIARDGIWDNNVVFAQALALCPLLAVTGRYQQGQETIESTRKFETPLEAYSHSFLSKPIARCPEWVRTPLSKNGEELSSFVDKGGVWSLS